MTENKKIKRALLRPKEYETLCWRDQFDIDKNLGLLDWKPTLKEQKLYKKLRNESKKS